MISFKTHTENICRIAKYKLHALQRRKMYLSSDKEKILSSVFIKSQFYDTTLIWMYAGELLI